MSEGGVRRGEGEVTEALGGREGARLASDGGGEQMSLKECIYNKPANLEMLIFLYIFAKCQHHAATSDMKT